MMIRNFRRFAGLWASVCCLVLAGLIAVGCKTGSSTKTFRDPATDSAALSNTVPVAFAGAGAGSNDVTKELRIRPGDSIIVTFSDLPKEPFVIPYEERVKEDGTILLLQNLTFTAAGKTRAELEQEVHDAYVPKFYVRLTVSVRQKQETQFYYVLGEVKMPGRQIYVSRLTVLGAIASAQGFTDFARKTVVKLTRSDGRQFTIDCNKALKNPKLDLEVYPGDTVYVPRKQFPWQ
jgi:protein involved in polysaccharide export with SLBB domain